MESTPVVVSALAEKIQQLRDRLEKSNNPERLDIPTTKFQVMHESETGTVISLRGSKLDLNPLLSVADLGLRVTSLETYRSGAAVVAVFLLNPAA